MRLLEEHVCVVDSTATSPVILHAPHGGRAIPEAQRGSFVVPQEEIERELLALTDHFTDELVRGASGAQASAVINGLSRFVVDVERFPDESEEKNAVGMGVLYTHGTRRQEIRRIGAADERLIDEFYVPYAAAVTDLVDAALAQHGRAIVVDVHSYSQHPQPHDLHVDQARPELCIGFDPFHATDALVEAVERNFARLQSTHNEPFWGAYVPLKHYRSDRRVQGVMLEIRRDVYMDEATGVADAGALALLQGELTALVAELAAGA